MSPTAGATTGPELATVNSRSRPWENTASTSGYGAMNNYSAYGSGSAYGGGYGSSPYGTGTRSFL